MERVKTTYMVGFNSQSRYRYVDLNKEPYGFRKNMRVQIQTADNCLKLWPKKIHYSTRRMACGVSWNNIQTTDEVITQRK